MIYNINHNRSDYNPKPKSKTKIERLEELIDNYVMYDLPDGKTIGKWNQMDVFNIVEDEFNSKNFDNVRTPFYFEN